MYVVAPGKPDKSVTIACEAAFDGQAAEGVFYLDPVTLTQVRFYKVDPIPAEGTVAP